MKSKDQRREEAEARQEIYEDLTDEQKIAKLNVGGFVAERERKRNGFSLLSEEVLQ